MGAMVSQIISLTIVYSTVYSSAGQGKHQSSASLAFVHGIHRWPVNSPHKWAVTRKMFPFDDVIMVTYSLALGAIWVKCKMSYFKVKFDHWSLRYLLWNCLHEMRSQIGSGNGLVPSGTTPLPVPMLTQLYAAMCHKATMSSQHEHHGVSNHRHHDCLLKQLLRVNSKKKHQHCALLARCEGIHRWQMDSLHKGPVMPKACPRHDVMMTTGITNLRDGKDDRIDID